MDVSKKSPSIPRARVYPISTSVGLIVAAVILSFVDLAFLSEVLGKVLDLSTSLAVAFSGMLGLVGIAIMAHHGIKKAHGDSSVWATVGTYALWLFLGIAFATIRVLSAYIMELGTDTGDEGLLTIMGVSIRQIDLILAPLMMLLFVATGIMTKDGTYHLFSNPAFETWRDEWKRKREEKQQKKAENAAKAMSAN